MWYSLLLYTVSFVNIAVYHGWDMHQEEYVFLVMCFSDAESEAFDYKHI